MAPGAGDSAQSTSVLCKDLLVETREFHQLKHVVTGDEFAHLGNRDFDRICYRVPVDSATDRGKRHASDAMLFA